MSNFNDDLQIYDTGDIPSFAKDFFDTDGNRTKVEPPSEIQQTGLKIKQPFARIWHNRFFFVIFQYIKWISGDYVEETDLNGVKYQVENREPLGTVKTVAQSRGFTETDASTYWGGTWSRTTDTVGSVSVHVFEKTANPTE